METELKSIMWEFRKGERLPEEADPDQEAKKPAEWMAGNCKGSGS